MHEGFLNSVEPLCVLLFFRFVYMQCVCCRIKRPGGMNDFVYRVQSVSARPFFRMGKISIERQMHIEPDTRVCCNILELTNIRWCGNVGRVITLKQYKLDLIDHVLEQ